MKIIIIPNNTAMWGRHYCIAKTLVEQGHEVHYLSWELPYHLTTKETLKHLATSLFSKQYKYEDFTIHKVSRLPYFWPHINGLLFKHQAKKLYRKLDADIIFSESYTNETSVPKGAPYIYDLADDYAAPAEVYGSFFYKLAFKLLGVSKTMKKQSSNALAVTAVSQKLCEFAKQYNDNVLKLPNGVDTKIIKEVLEDKSTHSKNKYSMIYVSGFGQWSRTIETIQTVLELRKEFPEIELTLVGEGPEEKKINTFIKDNHAEEYIHFIGLVKDRKELFELINQSAIGLNISDKNKWRDAAHPIKVLEYSALGKKVISTDLDEVKALGYSNIFMFSDKDKRNNLKSVMRKALKAPRNEKKYKAISESVLKEYNWTKFTNKLVVLIKTVKSEDDKPAIVHVTSSYPPNLGGLEKVVQTLARIQSRIGLKSSVITARSHNEEEISDSVEVTRLSNYKIANTTIMPGLLSRLLRLRRNDVVHLHIVQAYAPEIVWFASKLRGFRYIANIHLDVPPTGRAGFILKVYKPLVLKRVLRTASFVTVFTEDQKLEVNRRYDVELEKIKVIPNGVEEKFYYDKPRKLHIKPRLLFVGRLDIQKNLQLLLNALDGISEQFETTIVGEGSLSSDLKKMAKDLKLKNVKFVGRKDDKELLNYYKRSDVFVLPSEREGMPLVLLEAMAMGLPIIATNVTGSRDVVKNGKNGYLVPFGNVKSFRSSLLKIKSNESTYKKLSQTSRKMADKYSWEKISGQFEKLYAKNKVSLKEQNLTKLKLWHILLPVLVVANASYFLKDFLGWIPTLCFFLFIPGYLLFNLLKHGVKSRWIIASYSLGLSLLLLMVGGLLLNELHVFGLARPLVTGNIFIMLDIMTLILLAFNIHKPFKLPVINVRISKELVIMATLLALLPLLAIGGAMRLNNGASNILTMVLFASVAILFVLLSLRKSLKPIYPYALFMMAVAVLFSTSLRGWYITGHDIHHEFGVFQAVSNSGIWHVKVAAKDPYNACLSITILPTIIAKITTISAPYVYKVVFQIIFALGIVPVYYFIKRISTSSKALIGAFIFISFPTFLNDMPFLNRQEIAFVLFALLLLTTFTKMARAPKTILTLLLVVGVLLSHYSTNYVMLALIVLSWCFYKALMYKRKKGKAFSIPLLSLPIIIFALLVTYTWGTVMTQTAPSLKHTITHGINTLTSKTIIRSTAVQYSLFTPASQSSKSEFQKYVGKYASQAHYVSPEISPITRIGKVVSRVINVKNLNNFIHLLIAKIYQVLLLVGIVLSSILYFRRRKKELSHKDIYLFSLVLSSLVLLILLTILPRVSVDYSVTRLFQQTLIITALPIIIATEFLFGFLGRLRKYAVIALFALLFLDLSGFIPQATGGFLPQLSLNNSGQYYDFFYTHKSDVVGVQWLEENQNTSIPIFEDTDSSAPIQGYYHKIGLINNKSSSGYLYEDYTNVHSGVYRVFINDDLIEYTDPHITVDRNLIYANQDTRIYSKSGQ